MQYYVYILLCKNNSLYTGYTNNLKKRIAAHFEGKGCKYTKSFKPERLVASFKLENKNEALSLEAKIKNLSRKDKDLLIISPSSFINIFPAIFQVILIEEV
ncbi:MAG: GIY-YIG nuclease family protein [Clostridia bacterium]